MEVYVKGIKIYLDPIKSIGKGGEADVYDIGGRALKIFKPASHPDYEGLPCEQEAAQERLLIHQEKLPTFPKNLPSRVIIPEDLAFDRYGRKIVGYTMKFIKDAEVLLRFSEKGFRQAVPNNIVVDIFKDLHQTAMGVHKAGVVIGDFNDLNVLVRQGYAFLIDADSFQFGKFFCQVFTTRFLDPLLSDPSQKSLVLKYPYKPDSDWYSFSIMLLQCLLFVHPFGGIYQPKDPKKRILHDERPMHRITIFHPEVRYPKPATPYKVLPDNLLQYFHLVFEKDKRGEFPYPLLESLQWTKCSVCGQEHARNICPYCQVVPEVMVKEVTVIRGKVTSTRIFKTRGHILFATMQGGKLLWLYHENSQFKREDGTKVVDGELDPLMRFRMKKEATLIGKGSEVITFTAGKPVQRLSVETFGANLPVFDANEYYRYWTYGGQLLRESDLGVGFTEFIGNILSFQTLFWVGPFFGFGLYRAGNLSVAFVFDAKLRGINDQVKLPPLRGQLIDSTCFFTQKLCWFLVATSVGGRIINQCFVIKSDGKVEAQAQAEAGDDSWLSRLRSKCAVGNFLFAATDEGIVRVEIEGNQLKETKKFPDTEPFVDNGSHLFPSQDGLYIVSQREIKILKIG